MFDMIDEVSGPNYGVALAGGIGVGLLGWLPPVQSIFRVYDLFTFRLLPVVGRYITAPQLLLFVLCLVLARRYAGTPVSDLLQLPFAMVVGYAITTTVSFVVSIIRNPMTGFDTYTPSTVPSYPTRIANLFAESLLVPLVFCGVGIVVGSVLSADQPTASPSTPDPVDRTGGNGSERPDTDSQTQSAAAGSGDGGLSLDGTLTLRNQDPESIGVLLRVAIEDRAVLKEKITLDTGDALSWNELPPAHSFRVDMKTSTGQRDSLSVENRGANATDVTATVSTDQISMTAE